MEPDAKVIYNTDADDEESATTEELDETQGDDLFQQYQLLNGLPTSWGLTENNTTAEMYEQLRIWTMEELVVEDAAQELRANAGAFFRRYSEPCIPKPTVSWDEATSLFLEWVQTTMPGFAVSAGFLDQLFIQRIGVQMLTFPKHTYHHGTCLLFAPSIAQFGLMPAQSHRRGVERESLPAAIWCNSQYHPSKKWSQRVELGDLLGTTYMGWFLTCSCCVTEKDLQQTQPVDMFIVEFEQMKQLDGVVIMPRVRGAFKPPSDL
jgi:hypothetical protein